MLWHKKKLKSLLNIGSGVRVTKSLYIMKIWNWFWPGGWLCTRWGWWGSGSQCPEQYGKHVVSLSACPDGEQLQPVRVKLCEKENGRFIIIYTNKSAF